ncbi:trifunctional dihydropteroate synthetase [Arthrobotrys musiformis]|uniref:Folic acid synthesis protein FOL1 n=1 Tax=Arthrobotrys musiformis TaxID=47236 RepID=A0AAV9WLX3_9PEZI
MSAARSFRSVSVRTWQRLRTISILSPSSVLNINIWRGSLLPRVLLLGGVQRRTYIDLKTMAFQLENVSDFIAVNELALPAIVGLDGWHKPKLQPLLVSLRIKTSVGLAGSTDHLIHSINYGTVCKKALEIVQKTQFLSLEHLAETLAAKVLGDELRGQWVYVKVEQPKTLLRADSAALEIVRRKDGIQETQDKVLIKNLRIATIIGINDCERLERQQVLVNLTLYKPAVPAESAKVNGHVPEKAFVPVYDAKKISDAVVDFVEASDYGTIEALVTGIAKVACVDCGVESITVRAEKPSALALARSSEVEVTRHRSYFASSTVSSDGSGDEYRTAFIAFGSNLGDKFILIRDALAELNKRDIRVIRTSSLYESKPMYVEDQDQFLNGVCQVQTKLGPIELLRELQAIENHFGRVKIIDKGPRNIDLDILLYGTQIVNEPDLIIPHASMLEREFVLRPLCDIAPDLPHPQTSTTFASHLSTLPGESTVYPRVLLSPSIPSLQPSNKTRPTHIMAIINLTPDSFSDGGVHTTPNIEETVSKAVKAGVSIVDLGGMSTRPNAAEISEAEEIDRVIPAIKAIRSSSDPAVKKVTISIDTFRSSVAREAVNAGADIINDISGGLLDPEMINTAIQLDVPIMLMHMRGTPQTMSSLANYPDGVIETVGIELEERLDAALKAGVKRWKIILDPGLGFAKTTEHNLEILRNFAKLKARKRLVGIPWLIGPSRKKFIGEITGVPDASQRQWGTGAAVTASVAGGVDIIRVHDIDEMTKVAKMADAIWRN